MKLPITQAAIFVIISNGFHSLASSISILQSKRDAIITTAAPRNCPCGVKGSDSGGGRIVGGDDAEPHEYPWQVGEKMTITTLMVVVIGVVTLCLWGFMISLQLHTERLASRSMDVSPGVEGL